MPKNPTILVTGGAGYIGGHVLLALIEAGMDAVVIDDLSTGRREAVPEGIRLIEGNCGDPALLEDVLGSEGIGSTSLVRAPAVAVPWFFTSGLLIGCE